MKKIIALVLAIMMIASMSLVVFAAEEPDGIASDFQIADTDEPIAGTSKDTEITYTVLKGYVVIIPDDFALKVTDQDDGTAFGTGEGKVAIMKAKLQGTETLTISAKGTSVTGLKDYNDATIDNNWVLTATNGSKPVGYDIKVTGDVETIEKLAQEQTIVSYRSGEALSTAGRITTLSLTTDATPQAGEYKDTLTFTVAIA